MTAASNAIQTSQHIEILRDLVALDSTSRNSNLPMIEYIQAKLELCHGIKTWRVYSPDGTKANLIAQIGPDGDGGVLFSGHTDVVPVDGQKWDGNPFELAELPDGKLRGRGTTDMKGFVACVLSQAQTWSQTKLAKPVYMVFSYDEEVGCRGVISAVEDLRQRKINPDLCIVGEPTQMQVATAHKSRARVWVTAQATGGHASMYNDDAITSASDLVTLFNAKIIHSQEDVGIAFKDEGLGNASLAVTGFEQANTNNVIASTAIVNFDFRGRPGTSAQDLHAHLDGYAQSVVAQYQALGKTGAASMSVRVEMMNPGFKCNDAAAIKLATMFADNMSTIVVPYVCEAARFWDAGFENTVIIGPGHIRDAHQPNETIARADLDTYLGLLQRVTEYVKAPAP